VSLLRDLHDDRRGAVVDHAGRTVAPVDVVAARRVVDRLVALVRMAIAQPADVLAAAVVVRNDVILAVGWIAAGTDPGHRRLLGAGRTRVLCAAATRAEETVDGTMTPVVAVAGIAGGRRRIRLAGGCAERTRDGEQRQCGGADDEGGKLPEKA